MPITTEPRPPSAAAIQANRGGMTLRAQGRLAEAAAAFERGIAAAPDLPELHLNLAETLVQLGRLEDAHASYESALRCDPASERALWALYELDQVAGRREQALARQAAALEQRTLLSIYAPHEQRRLLVLLAPGDWQANVPIDYLVDAQTTTLHKLYLVSPAQARDAALPAADAVFTAIAESPENAARLQWAAAIEQRSGLPVINAAKYVTNTERSAAAALISGIPHVRVPHTAIVSDEQLLRGEITQAYPLVVRPVGSQAGRDLEKIGDAAELAAYAQRVGAAQYYVMPFVDYASGDGYFRKYRIFVVGGVPCPCHLAISPRWMIHYYNAPMREHEWMREEERRVLLEFERVFPHALREALQKIAAALQLDYVGVDCAIDREGNLLVFEADPAMIVHAADDPAMFAYKHTAAKRIFEAFAALVDRARSR